MFIDDNETEIQPLGDSGGSDASRAIEPTIDSRELETEPSAGVSSSSRPTDVRPVDDAPTEARSSDAKLAVEATLAAPTFPKPSPRTAQPPGAGRGSQEVVFEAGEEIGDFEIIELLGRGAFGAVYMARQLSLDRSVALKITANRGSEGRTMARLEHAGIVQVFSEEADPSGKLRLLCMQLVPGAPLDAVVRDLNKAAKAEGGWAGFDYLASIDERTVVSGAFDPSALRDRELLDDSGDVEVTAWVGARLAEAINFAHANGVLHRDIKPANVLINQYGRPMLADFNIAFRSTSHSSDTNEQDQSTFGGTLAFMAPEHLDAFDPHSEATPDDVDERSDIYSLGIVAYELLCGRHPFQDPQRNVSRIRYVAVLSKWRREAPAPIAWGPPNARKVLQRTIAKSLAPDKGHRYQTGEEFAAALEGCRHLAFVERTSPAAGAFAQSVIRRPLAWAMLLIFLPQVVGSVVNIAYNQYQIAGLLNEPQQAYFMQLVSWYNTIVYPAALGVLAYFFWPIFKMWRDLRGSERVDATRVAEVRRAALRLPLWVLTAAAVGWLPGGVIFPAMLAWRAPPIDAHVWFHFFVSFAFSGLIAVAYSFCGMQYIAMRVLYPRLWTDATHFRATARRELSGTTWRLWFSEIAAYAVPFCAMIVLTLVQTQASGPETRAGGIPLKTLILSLACLGLAGTAIVRLATGVMAKIHAALIGRD